MSVNWLEHAAYLLQKALPMVLASFVMFHCHHFLHTHNDALPPHYGCAPHGQAFFLKSKHSLAYAIIHLLSSKAHICILEGIEAIPLFKIRFLELWELESIFG